SFIFSFLDLINEIGDSVFEIKIRVIIDFSDSIGSIYKTETIFDFSEFKGISEVGGGDPSYNLYKETEKIRNILEEVQSSMSAKRFNVNVYSSDNRIEEKIDLQERIEKNRSSVVKNKE